MLSIHFLPARRYASAGNSDRNVSVCPSVRHAPVLCQNEESYRHDFFTIWFSDAKFHHQILSGSPRNGGLKQGSVGKIQQFLSFKRQYLENGSRYGQSYY